LPPPSPPAPAYSISSPRIATRRAAAAGLRACFAGSRDFAGKITITNTNPDAAENLGSVDESYEHEADRVIAGDVNRRAFAYMMVAGGTLAYASFARTAVLKFLDSMNASAVRL
jgi:hypothetical protein